jgi:hypothetical protein
MRVRIEIKRTDDTNQWGKLRRVVDEFMAELGHRYGNLSPVEHTMARVLRDSNGGILGRMDVLDGDLAQPEPARKPYDYDVACAMLRKILSDLETIEGAKVGPSGATWQDVAGTAAVKLRAFAAMLDAAREGRVRNGPVVFPGVEECLSDSRDIE